MVLPQFQPTLGAYVHALLHRFDKCPPSQSTVAPLTRGGNNRSREHVSTAKPTSSELSLKAFYASLAEFSSDFPLFSSWLSESFPLFTRDLKQPPSLPRSPVSELLPVGYMCVSSTALLHHSDGSWSTLVSFTTDEQQSAPFPSNKNFYWRWC